MKVKAITDFLNNWEDMAKDYYFEAIQKGREIERKYKEDSKNLVGVECMPLWRETVKKYWDNNKKAQEMLYSSCWRGNEEILKTYIADEIKKERNKKEKALMNRVTKIVGSIIDGRNLKVSVNGEINGIIIGELGRVEVETVYAGGYNIQRLHYRVLLKKMK